MLLTKLKVVPVGQGSQTPFWALKRGLSWGHFTGSHFWVVELYTEPVAHWTLSLHWPETISKAELLGQVVQFFVVVFHKGVAKGHF